MCQVFGVLGQELEPALEPGQHAVQGAGQFAQLRRRPGLVEPHAQAFHGDAAGLVGDPAQRAQGAAHQDVAKRHRRQRPEGDGARDGVAIPLEQIEDVVEGACHHDRCGIAVTQPRLHCDAADLSPGCRAPLPDVGVQNRLAVGDRRGCRRQQPGRIEVHQDPVATRTDLHQVGVVAGELPFKARHVGAQRLLGVLRGHQAAQVLRLENDFPRVAAQQLLIEVVVQVAADEVEGQQRDQGKRSGQSSGQGQAAHQASWMSST